MSNNANILYYELLKNNIVYFLIANEYYQLDLINNTLTKEKDSIFGKQILTNDFNYFDKALLLKNSILIHKSNHELLTISPLTINENTIIQAKNLNAASFTLDSNFLINKVNVLASNRLELAYFNKYILTNELRGLNINYQELVYLLKNEFIYYFQIKLNNILITKVTSQLMQLTYHDHFKNNFQAYETYSYFLNIDDFFINYEHQINQDFYNMIITREEQENQTVLKKALSSDLVINAIYQNNEKFIIKYDNNIYSLNN